jgi:hypothetical protein
LQQHRQLGDIYRNLPRLIFDEQLCLNGHSFTTPPTSLYDDYSIVVY